MPVLWKGSGAPEWKATAAAYGARAAAMVRAGWRPQSLWSSRRQGQGLRVDPFTKPGHLVKDVKIKSLEEIYLFSLPIRESEITDSFLGASLKHEVLKIMPVQKQTRAAQQTRVKTFVATGGYSGHVSLGVKCSKEIATAILGAIILAKLSIIPMWQGYWRSKISKPHTVPGKETSRCGSAQLHLIATPRGMVSALVPKKLLMTIRIDDCYISARSYTATQGNPAKAAFDTISKTYSCLAPDIWKETVFTKSPSQGFTDHIVKTHTRLLLWPPHSFIQEK
ncbi:40S ribosomal protein S2-like [Ursus maritimus]|uniref:Small ribosomal subunit protein uS5 n=2 Tax=Ursus maritimus TaxID=29073 RepID=A0A8M1GK48_URSMA|nr:40S ribosomal protein S2-like [Ursus maritimus]